MAIYNISRIQIFLSMPSLTIFDSPFTVNNTMKMQLLKVYKKNEKPLLGKVRQCTVFLSIGSSAKV